MSQTSVIVFSKNRPMQLYALLESMFVRSNIPRQDVHVLYKADESYLTPMKEVKADFPEVNFIEETDFRGQCLHLIHKAKKYVVFFTDDNVFKDNLDIQEVESVMDSGDYFCFSLRLGKHLNWCFSTNKSQAVPEGETKGDMFSWSWPGKEWDWNYPCSVDGHVFSQKVIENIAKICGPWRFPNSLEGNLAAFHHSFERRFPKMVCYTSSKVFNIPDNTVNVEVINLNGGGNQYFLLSKWEEGYKVDIKPFLGYPNKAAHEVVPLTLVARRPLGKKI